MLDVTGYTLGANEPLTHARILWDMAEGDIGFAGTGTDVDFAANDYTAQRWTLGAGFNDFRLTTPAAVDVDCVFISAHNLSGQTVKVFTSPDLVTAYTLRTTIVPTDNSTIAIMFNDGAGDPISAQRILVRSEEGTGVYIGIIRIGKALQMQRPFYAGFAPTRLNRITEGQQSFSETGQWLGRTEKRRALVGSYNWQYLKADWYRANFEPFARTLPLKPFGIIGNPSSISDDVVWAWARSDVRPSNMGIVDLMQVGIDLTGYWE